MNENIKKPPETWRYVEWVGGQEAFDRMFTKYPEQIKSESEKTIMCADMINGVM